MATVNSRTIVDKIIAGNGIYPGDEDYSVVKIVQYNNDFDGGLAYGIVYEGESLLKYEKSPFIHNPVVIWERK